MVRGLHCDSLDCVSNRFDRKLQRQYVAYHRRFQGRSQDVIDKEYTIYPKL